MSNGFCLLWSKILRSSIWVQESKETRLLWIALMALKDSRGIVQASVVGLADAAKITPEECRSGLRVLLSPDPHDSSGVDEGRRLREVPGGWKIVNHDLYRFSTEAKREFWRTQKAEQRANAKKGHTSKAQQGRNGARRSSWRDKKEKEHYQRADDQPNV